MVGYLESETSTKDEMSTYEFEFGLDAFLPVTVDESGQPVGGAARNPALQRLSVASAEAESGATGVVATEPPAFAGEPWLVGA